MSNREKPELPDAEVDHVVDVTDQSWLKVKDGFKGANELGYGTLDIAGAPDVSDEEYNEMCLEEKLLREQLRQVDTWQKNATEVAQLMTENNLASVLQEWFTIHMRNKAVYMKKNDGDVFINPTTQILIQAARLLQH